MEFYLSLSNQDPGACTRLAVLAEDLGFGGITLPDHLFMPSELRDYPYSEDGQPPFSTDTLWPDVWVLIGAMATVTRRIRFRTCVYILPLRHPLVVARAVATAACIGPGRVDLGVGAGWLAEEFETMSIPFTSRGSRMEESMMAVRMLLQGEEVRYEGRHWQFGPALVRPAPPSRVPVLVGGVSERALRRAATLADGYIAPPLTMRETIALRARLDEMVKSADRQGNAAFQFHARPTDAREPGHFDWLAESGVQAVQVVPWTSGKTNIDQRVGDMEAFANRFLG